MRIVTTLGPLMSPRRIVRAVGMTLLALLLLGGVLGVVAANDRGPSNSAILPSVFGLSEPRIGDRGEITRARVHVEDGVRTTLEAEAFYAAFEWVDDRIMRDHEGRLVRAHALWYQDARTRESQPQGATVVLFEAGTLRYLGSESVVRQNWSQPGSGLLSPPSDDESWWRSVWTQPAGSVPPVCGFVNALQGQTVDPAGPFRVLEACSSEYMMSGSGIHETFYAVGVLPEGSGLIVDTGRNTAPVYTMHLRQELPYPSLVEIAEVHAIVDGLDEELRSHDVTVLRLSRFERGGQAWSSEQPSAPPAPRLEFAPRQPWGPDDTGVDHPFPLRVAYQRAIADPQYPKLRDYLAAHPDALMHWARYAEFDMQGADPTMRWEVHFGDDTSWFGTCIELRGEPIWPGPGAGLPTLDDLAQGRSIRYEDSCARRSLEPNPVAPAYLPTVRSLMDLWKAYAQDDWNQRIPHAWEFSFSCQTELPCEPGAWGASAGVTEYLDRYDSGLPWDPLGNRTAQWRASAVHVSSEYLVYEEHASTTVYHATPPPSREEPEDVLPLSIDARAPVWILPEAVVVAGVGGAAILLGLVYWIWPTIKGLLTIPLFSRIEQPTALDQPSRAQIAQLVEAQPGIHFQELVRRSGQGVGAVNHHLRKLVDVGLVVPHVGPGYTCYFPKGAVDRRLMAAAPLLKADGARRALATIVAQPGLIGVDLARQTALTRQSIHHYLHRFAEAGLVTLDRNGREVRILPTDLARAALAGASTVAA